MMSDNNADTNEPAHKNADARDFVTMTLTDGTEVAGRVDANTMAWKGHRDIQTDAGRFRVMDDGLVGFAATESDDLTERGHVDTLDVQTFADADTDTQFRVLLGTDGEPVEGQDLAFTYHSDRSGSDLTREGEIVDVTVDGGLGRFRLSVTVDTTEGEYIITGRKDIPNASVSSVSDSGTKTNVGKLTAISADSEDSENDDSEDDDGENTDADREDRVACSPCDGTGENVVYGEGIVDCWNCEGTGVADANPVEDANGRAVSEGASVTVQAGSIEYRVTDTFADGRVQLDDGRSMPATHTTLADSVDASEDDGADGDSEPEVMTDGGEDVEDQLDALEKGQMVEIELTGATHISGTVVDTSDGVRIDPYDGVTDAYDISVIGTATAFREWWDDSAGEPRDENIGDVMAVRVVETDGGEDMACVYCGHTEGEGEDITIRTVEDSDGVFAACDGCAPEHVRELGPDAISEAGLEIMRDHLQESIDRLERASERSAGVDLNQFNGGGREYPSFTLSDARAQIEHTIQRVELELDRRNGSERADWTYTRP